MIILQCIKAGCSYNFINVNDVSKIKILIFTPTLKCGGSEKFVSFLCNHINTDHFTVCLVVLKNTGQFYQIENKNIEVIDLEESRVRYSLFKLKRVVHQFGPDIVFSTANHLNLYFAIFRKWFPGQVKFLARESSIVSINSQRAPMPWLYNRLVRKYYRRFDLILCQSLYMQQDIVHHYKIPESRTVLISNVAEASEMHRKACSGKNATEPYKFITVGRLSDEKGIERLIHAVGLLTADFRFYIIGSGPKKAYLQNLVNKLQLQKKIFFEGERAAPFSGMEDADLFLMGSYYEGFPNVLLEAGACGIPVVAFNAPGGIPEIINEGENGMLADDNDILGFAAAIKQALSHNFDRNKITESTRKRFSVDAVIKKMEKLLTGLSR